MIELELEPQQQTSRRRKILNNPGRYLEARLFILCTFNIILVLKFSLGLVVLLSLVYVILVSLALLTAGLHLTFTPQVLSLVHNNVQLIEKNDILGFCLGQLSTALLQSSSVRTEEKF